MFIEVKMKIGGNPLPRTLSKYCELMLIATIHTIVPIDSVLYNNVVIYYTANTEKRGNCKFNHSNRFMCPSSHG